MATVVFWEGLRRHWRVALYWGLALGFLSYITASIIKDVKMLKQFADMMAVMPPAFLRMIGGTDAAALATPEGFLATGVFSRILIIMAIYAVLYGLSVSANEEEQGILDVVLSLPIPRWRMIVEKFAVYVIGTILILVVIFVATFIGLQATALTIDYGKIFQATFGLLPQIWLTLAVTVFCGTFFRSRGTAMAVASVVIVGSYFLDTLGQSVEGLLNTLRPLSFFSYYSATNVMVNGLNWTYFGFISLLALALVAASVWFFQRRDIGV